VDFLKICDLRALAVAWSLADLAGRVQPGIEEVKSAMGFRRMGLTDDRQLIGVGIPWGTWWGRW
jgi:hypothetical protein